MRDNLLFIYNFYEYYFYLVTCVLFGFIAFCSNRRQVFGVKRKSIVLIIGFILESFFSVIMKHIDFVEELRDTNHPLLYEMIIKIVCCIIFSSTLMRVIIFVGKCTGGGGIFKRDFIRENQYGLIIGAVTFIWLIINLPLEINGWVSAWYVTNYSMGLGSRFFIGTFLNLFYDDFLDKKIALRFCVCVLVLIILLVSGMFNQLIKKVKEEHRPAILFLILCFMASPGYIRAMWQSSNMGRLETYTFFLALISIIIFENISNIYLKYGCVTVLSCVSMAIYQGDLFLYYPIIIMIIVYDNLTNHHQVIGRRMLGMVNILCTAAAFAIFQFFSYTIFNTPQDMVQALSEKTNLTIEETAIRLELFESIAVAYNELNKKSILEGLLREKALLTLCLIVPSIIIILSLYMKCIQNQTTDRQQIFKKPYVYYILVNFAVLPQFLLNVDWGRWMLAFNIVMFFGVFYLTYKQDQGMLCAMDKLSVFVRCNPFLAITVIMYMATLGNYRGAHWLAPVDSIIDWIQQKDFWADLLLQ